MPSNGVFSAKYADAETGLVYYGFRYYLVGLGRWLNNDPIHEAGGINLYTYAHNTTLDEIDLLGLSDWSGQVTVSLLYPGVLQGQVALDAHVQVEAVAQGSDTSLRTVVTLARPLASWSDWNKLALFTTSNAGGGSGVIPVGLDPQGNQWLYPNFLTIAINGLAVGKGTDDGIVVFVENKQKNPDNKYRAGISDWYPTGTSENDVSARPPPAKPKIKNHPSYTKWVPSITSKHLDVPHEGCSASGMLKIWVFYGDNTWTKAAWRVFTMDWEMNGNGNVELKDINPTGETMKPANWEATTPVVAQ